MADTSPDNLRGFIIPLEMDADNQWADQSIFTQGTRRAGLSSPDQDSGLVVQTSGLQGTDIITIRTAEAGHIQDKPKFEWKESTESDYYGSDAANMLSHWRTVVSNSGTATTTLIPRDAIRLSETSEIIAVAEKQTASQNSIQIIRISTTGTATTTNIETVATGTLVSQSRHGALCEMPDGSILLAHWQVNSIDNTANLLVYRSIDNGVNWSLKSKRALPDNISVAGSPGAGASGFDLARIRMAASSSQVILLAELQSHNTSLSNRNLCAQYASTSEGMKFTEVITTSGAQAFHQMDVETVGEAFVISWLEVDGIKITRLTNAHESIGKALTVLASDSFSFPSTTATATANLLAGEKSMWLDDDQRLYIVAESTALSDKGDIFVAFSELLGISYRDLGKTWVQLGQALSSTNPRCYTPSDTDDNLKNIIGVSGTFGDQMLLVNMEPGDTGNNHGGSLFGYHLGGYGTVTYPRLIEYPQERNRGMNFLDWLPIRLPAVTGWTASGTGTEALQGDHFQLDVTAGNTKAYSQTFADKTGGFIAKFKVKVVSGASTTKGTGFDVQIEEIAGSNVYTIRLVIGLTHLYLYDANASTTVPIAFAGSLSAPDGFDIILQLDNATGVTSVYYRASTVTPRRYSLLQGTAAAATGSGNQVKFGVTSGHVANIECHWFNVSYSIGATRTGKLIDTTKNNAKPYPPHGFMTHIANGLKISTKDGPAREGETFQIAPRFDTPATNMLYAIQPSARVGWRGDAIANPDTNNTPQERVAWQIDTALTANHRTLGGTFGISLKNINFKDVTIERYDAGSTSWVSVATFANGIPFNFTRAGNTISSTSSSGEFFHFGECIGWRVMLTSGDTSVVRKINYNAEGVLSNQTTKQCIIQLEDALTGDPASGSAFLIPNDLTVLLSSLNDTAGYRINITAQRTREGYFEIGKMVMGPVVFPAHQYGRGRTIQYVADVESSTQSNGILRTHATGDGGRTFRIAWAEGVDISELFDSPANPDYYTSSSAGAAIPTAAEGSAPTTMLGLVKHLVGSSNAVVYLPIVRRSAATERSLNRYHEHAMVTVGDDLQIENVLGDESLGQGSGELMRVGTVTLREIR